jgi:hypothetical protein
MEESPMRKLIWIIGALLVIYGGFWFTASRTLLSGVEAALSQMKTEGRADYTGVRVAGFPSRLDLTVDNLSLVSADGFTRWTTPFLQVFALSYHPNQIIALWPHDQTVTLGNQLLTLTTSDLRASALFGAKLDLPLDHTTLVGLDGKLSSDFGWTATFDRLQLSSRLTGASPLSHEIYLALTGFDLTGVQLPDSVNRGVQGSADVDAELTFDGPLAVNAEPAKVTAVDIGVLRVRWGGAELHAKGRLEVTESGTPEGRISLTLTGWQSALDLAVAMGAVRPELAPTYGTMLDQLARESPEPGTLELPLVFKDGLMSLGPVPLGPAPRLAGYSQ